SPWVSSISSPSFPPFPGLIIFSLGIAMISIPCHFSDTFLLHPFPGRPCVDCHAFEFMQRALQDLKKTAYNLDTRVGVTLEMILRFNVPTHPD
uniref:NELL2-interacting cell ontogeny regulator 1 n=1 Tax=Chelonoidis abingdonii TaxID=106734 RepID=A0A8C0FZR6_CHEAB